MKSWRTGGSGLFPVLWEGLVSVRLTLFLIAGMLVVSVIGTVIAQHPTSPVPLEQLYSPETLYAMDLLGLTDIFHSGWFIFILTLLALNLICGTIERIPAAWRHAMQKVPGALNLEQALSKKHEKLLYVRIPTQIGREQFREVATKFSRGKVGKPQAVKDEGGLNELQLVSQEGRFTRVAGYVMHLSILLILAGALVGSFGTFEGTVNVPDGERVAFVQVIKGDTHRWPQLEEQGKPIAGFYKPGFEIECTDFDPRETRSRLNFYEGGKLVASREVSVNSPARYAGLTFYQGAYANSGRLRANFTVSGTDKDGEETRQILHGIPRGGTVELEGAKLKVLEIQAAAAPEGDASATPEMGVSAQLEYQEEGKAPETFWVFERYPDYDSIHRKHSRLHFMVEGAQPTFTTTLQIRRDPGAPLVWAGFAIFALTLLISLQYSHNRYWWVWNSGSVIVLAWSNRLFLFEPHFERVMNQFRNRLAKADKSMKPGAVEVQHGS